MQKQFKFSSSCAISQLVTTFSALFEARYRTRLVPGGDEPIYRCAKSESDVHQIVFTRDYFSSALHEVAHWCVAGPERRLKDDYGYWYAPDGRSDQQQQVFERVEVKPQSMERIFSFAACHPFRVSADNLHRDNAASPNFLTAIQSQTMLFCEQGLPSRARRFVEALAEASGADAPLCPSNYKIDDLR